jgi:hypothetical protein
MPNPLQKLHKTNTKQFGHNPPKSTKKSKKNGGFLRKRVSGWLGTKREILGFRVAGGGWVRWRMAGGGVLVVGEVNAGGGLGCFWI